MGLIGLNWIAYVVIGFIVSAGVGALLVRLLPLWQFRQTTYEDAPETHRQKTGTPTMGGICFVAAILALLFVPGLPLSIALVFLVVGCAGVGFVDDILAVRRGKNLGLRARTKYLATALIAIVFLRWIVDSYELFPRDVIFHAGTIVLVAPHWLWLTLGIVAVTGTVHAVNLTDGLDGLAAGTTIPPLAAFAAIGVLQHAPLAIAASSLGVGACFGFLVYNRHPAKMFMGDTGSLALGGLLAGVAILTGEMLLLIVIGGVFVAEALSVILQVTYFKRTGGKRIFLMSPLHHHFELTGLSETTVTGRFWLASAICSLVGVGIAR